MSLWTSFISSFIDGASHSDSSSHQPSEGHVVVGGGHFSSYDDHSVVGSRAHEVDQTASSAASVARDVFNDIDNRDFTMTCCDIIEPDASGSYADHTGDDRSSTSGSVHCDGHVEGAQSGQDNPAGKSLTTLIKDVLQGLMNGNPGDAARSIAESQVVQDALTSTATAAAETTLDALQTIGDSLSKDQP